MNQKNSLSVFTKQWRQESVAELGQLVSAMGVDGIEYPLREGYQVDLDKAEQELPLFVDQLSAFGLRVYSVAVTGSLEEQHFAASARAGIPLLRVMFRAPRDVPYEESERRAREQLDEAAVWAEQYGVRVGVQNHCNHFLPQSTGGMLHLLQNYDPRLICGIWDAGHNGLHGEAPALALPMIKSHLGMVNLKNAIWLRTNGPEAAVAQWRPYWTSGRHGLTSWPEVITMLRKLNYDGVICICNEYSDETYAEQSLQEDIAFVKSLL